MITSFSARLAVARRLLARGAKTVPVHLADQLVAAGREAGRIADRVGALMLIFEPSRDWFHRRHADASDEVRAYVLTAVLGCIADVCCHLRRGGPRPAHVLLPLRRVACLRCAVPVRRPVTAVDECGACRACAAVLGFSAVVAS